MVGVALVVTWGGYLLFAYGWQMVKGKSLGIVDCAAPSHRAVYLAAWS